MMGVQKAEAQLFYAFDLENHVPADHLLREIDRFLDMEGMRARLRPFYSHTGRPSIDPELIVRMLVIGYVMGIRSERRLCQDVHLNLAYRWFCRLGLDDKVPDHSTFSRYRHGKFRESGLLRQVFEATVERCLRESMASARPVVASLRITMGPPGQYRSIYPDPAGGRPIPGLAHARSRCSHHASKLGVTGPSPEQGLFRRAIHPQGCRCDSRQPGRRRAE